MASDSVAEHWRPVKGYEGRYEVSDLGQVRSLAREGAAKVLTLTVNGSGYMDITLSKPGRISKRYRVHRLVLQAFVGPCPPGHECSHMNGKPTDNRLDNLAWMSVRANNLLKRQHGTQQCKHSDAVVMEIRERWSRGETARDLAREFDSAETAIGQIVRGKIWKHLPVIPRRPGLRACLTAEIVADIRVRLAKGESQADIARSLQTNSRTINDIACGRTWRVARARAERGAQG